MSASHRSFPLTQVKEACVLELKGWLLVLVISAARRICSPVRTEICAQGLLQIQAHGRKMVSTVVLSLLSNS